MVDTEKLEEMIRSGRDSALSRFALGTRYMKSGDHGRAEAHLRRAVEMDPGYSAAWKALGRCLSAQARTSEAREVFSRALAVAREKGDKQVEREIGVFLKRLPPEAGT